MAHKKLYRSRKDRIIAGVFGGLGDYFDVDSTLLRLAFILVLLVTAIFPGLVVYLIAALIIPSK